MKALARIAGTATAAVLMLLTGVDRASPQGVAAAQQQPATLESCNECHRDLVVEFELTHGEELPPEGGANGAPTKCLVPNQSLTFRADVLPLEKSSRCLHCHAGQRSRFYAGPHGLAGRNSASSAMPTRPVRLCSSTAPLGSRDAPPAAHVVSLDEMPSFLISNVSG